MKKTDGAPMFEDTGPKRHKGTSIESREDQLIALAYDEVERRIREGTATSQELTHFLRMGSTREKREARMDELEMELKEAKREALESAKRIEQLYAEAIGAVRSYSSPVTQMPMSDHHD